MTNEHLITPCPVCGLEVECPHTPVRCAHSWSYVNLRGGKRLKTDIRDVGDVRTCGFCGRVERAKITWETVKP